MQFAQRPARAWALFGVMGQAYYSPLSQAGAIPHCALGSVNGAPRLRYSSISLQHPRYSANRAGELISAAFPMRCEEPRSSPMPTTI